MRSGDSHFKHQPSGAISSATFTYNYHRKGLLHNTGSMNSDHLDEGRCSVFLFILVSFHVNESILFRSSLTESIGVSETTPLHVNTSRTRQTHPSPTHRYSSGGNTADSLLTVTTFASSSTTLNDACTTSNNNADSSCRDGTRSYEDERVRKQLIRTKIKTTVTISILLLGLLLCFVTLIQYFIPFGEANNNGVNATNVPEVGVQKSIRSQEKEMFDEFDRYIIEDYDQIPPFSDFLPVSALP